MSDNKLTKLKETTTKPEDDSLDKKFSSNNIHSVRTEYDDNPLLSINKITTVPNNTPVNSPSNTPFSKSNSDKSNSNKLDNQTIPSSSSSASVSSSLNNITDELSISTKKSTLTENDEGGNYVNSNGGKNQKIIAGGQHFLEKRTANENKHVIQEPNNILGQNINNNNNNNKNNDNDNDNDFKNIVVSKDVYFDTNKLKTDPNVKNYPISEKSIIKMSSSSWLNSKYNVDEYSLSDINNKKNDSNKTSSGNETDSHIQRDILNEKPSNDTYLISNGNISSPKLPKLSVFNKLNENQSRLNSSRSNDISHYNEQFITSSTAPSTASTKLESKDNSSSNENNLEKNKSNSEELEKLPAHQPKFINSRLDGLRSRLLNNPKTATQKNEHPEDEDILGNAAAVLSNMRSSPFTFGDKNHQPSNNLNALMEGNTVRPHSSTFSSRGGHSYPRPRLIIHKSEESSNSISQPSTDEEKTKPSTDNNEEQDEYIYDESPALRIKHHNRKDVVTWNKNGKRISTKILENDRNKTVKLKSETPSSLVSSQLTPIKPKVRKERKKISPPTEESLKANISGARNSFQVISDSKNGKGNNGSRSRTGCWICRLRKKKCTEEKPSCLNCERLNLECFYDEKRPDFVTDPIKKEAKLQEIKKFTREAKRNAMKKRAFIHPPY